VDLVALDDDLNPPDDRPGSGGGDRRDMSIRLSSAEVVAVLEVIAIGVHRTVVGERLLTEHQPERDL
jgi:hypothetical protein